MEPLLQLSRRLGLVQVAVSDQLRTTLRNDRGEGVISMAIAVLIIAFIGAALWLVFRDVANDAGETISDQVDTIGG